MTQYITIIIRKDETTIVNHGDDCIKAEEYESNLRDISVIKYSKTFGNIHGSQYVTVYEIEG